MSYKSKEGINTEGMWDDLRVSVFSTKSGGSKEPAWTKILDNGAGSQGVFSYFFDSGSEEELYFAVQFPHSWQIGTDIEAHVHWVALSNGGVGQRVTWGLEYSWASIGDVFGNTTIITGSANYTDEDIVANKHYLTKLGTINGTGKQISSMMMCRVFRDATAGTDTYTSDAGLLEIDFHIKFDSLGSREEYVK